MATPQRDRPDPEAPGSRLLVPVAPRLVVAPPPALVVPAVFGTVVPSPLDDDLPLSPRDRRLPRDLVFSRQTALLHGWTPAAIEHAVKTGAWLRLHRNWYAAADRLSESAAARHAAEVVAIGRANGVPVVGTHESSGLVQGLWLLDAPEEPVVSRLRAPRGPRQALAAAALASQLPAHHLCVVLGAVVTTLARTAVDIARRGDPLAGVMAVDSALRMGVTRAQLEEVLEWCAGWPGVVLARELVEFGDARSESALESMGRWRFHEGELPTPELQIWYGNDRVDFDWKQHRTIGEADGLIKYDEAAGDGVVGVVGRDEKRRELRLTGPQDREVFRFDYAETRRRPRDLIARARRAFAAGDLRAEARRRLGL